MTNKDHTAVIDENAEDPGKYVDRIFLVEAVENLHKQLPERYQGTFKALLAAEMDVVQARKALGCTAGKVRRHLRESVRILQHNNTLRALEGLKLHGREGLDGHL